MGLIVEGLDLLMDSRKNWINMWLHMLFLWYSKCEYEIGVTTIHQLTYLQNRVSQVITLTFYHAPFSSYPNVPFDILGWPTKHHECYLDRAVLPFLGWVEAQKLWKRVVTFSTWLGSGNLNSSFMGKSPVCDPPLHPDLHSDLQVNMCMCKYVWV